MNTYMHAWIHACMDTCIHACMHTYIHTYLRTIDVYIYRYIHRCMNDMAETFNMAETFKADQGALQSAALEARRGDGVAPAPALQIFSAEPPFKSYRGSRFGLGYLFLN